MQKEEYRRLYKELYPLVERMQEILENHGVNKGISLTTFEDGYITLDLRSVGDYGLVKPRNGEDVLLWNNDPTHPIVTEPLFEKGEPECEESETCPGDTK
jgi:hypothetical protein